MVTRRRHPLVHFWSYTLLRIALFGVLLGVLWLSGLRGLLGAAVALALSVPLSFVLLARPRRAMAEEMRMRLAERQQRTHKFESRLSGDAGDAGASADPGDEAPEPPTSG